MSSSRSCRILTISSSVTQGKALVKQVITLPNSAVNQAAESSTGSTELPWTISNRYYTAPVHFRIMETLHVKSEDATDVPACMFVFSITEPFREDFSSLISRIGSSDFEVSIAVSTPAFGEAQSTEAEHDSLEAFFGEHGFEYVKGHTTFDPSQGNNIDDTEGIPGIGRIVDALSTILWPSMVQQAGSRRAKARSIVSVPGPPDEEEGLRAFLNENKNVSENTGLQREMAALEKWLEEGADDEQDPWEGQTFQSLPDEISEDEESQATMSRFDDNFSDFVSAPARADVGTIDDGDPALPSQAEIESMSRRIFNMVSTDDSDAQASFDLSRVLGALEAMKEEIAGITDEDEKRKAAAKVALGLVYGLELDEG